jgi:hypothetical protein
VAERSARKRVALLVAAALLSIVVTACDVGRPWPASAPALHGHHAVLMIGDSLVGQTDTELPAAFDRAGLDVEVVDAHVNGSGLLGPVGDAPTALDWVQEQVAAHPGINTVVIQWIGACGQACDATQPNFVEYGSPEFIAEWTTNAHAIIDWLLAHQKVVVWAVSPPIGADMSGGAFQMTVEATARLAALDRDDFAVRAGSVPVDWAAALTSVFGTYTTTLRYDGGTHTVRWPSDLLHLTADGAVRTSAWTVKPLADLWAANPGLATAGSLAASTLVARGDPVTLDVPPGG